jgi:hypothetical protein
MAETLVDQADRERADRDRDEREKALKAQREAEERTEKYMQADEFVVTAPYVTLKMIDPNGGPLVIKGFNEGAVVDKEDVDEANLRHHVETGLVAPKDSDEAQVAAPAGTPKPAEPPNVPVEEVPVSSLSFQERQRRNLEAVKTAEKDGDKAETSRAGRRTPKSDTDNG